MPHVLQKIFKAIEQTSTLRLICVLGLVALLAGFTTINRGLQSDDYLHRYMLLNEQSTLSSQLNDFFDFLGPSETLAWWAHPDLKINFWRPFSALTHWFDYQLWPNHIQLMHWHSSIWYILLVVLCFVFFKQLFKFEIDSQIDTRINKNTLAFIAALLFCIDFSHFSNISWLANRNSLIASVFIVSSLIFYSNWKTTQKLFSLLLSAAMFVLSLLSAESGIALLAIICLYEIVFRNKGGSSAENKLNDVTIFLGPCLFLLIACLWFVFYTQSGFGSTNNAMYFSPFSDVLHSIQLLALKIPVFLFGNFFGIEGFYNIFSLPAKAVISSLCLLACLCLFKLCNHLFKSKVVKFLLLACFIPLLPVSFVAVLDMRLGIYTSIFSAGLLALIFYWLYLESPFSKVKQFVFLLLIISHVLVATAQWVAVGLRDWQQPPNSFAKLHTLNSTYTNKDIYIFNYPSPIDAYYFPFAEQNNLNTLYILNNNLADYVVNASSANSLLLQTEQGFIFQESDLKKIKKTHGITSGVYARAAFNGMLPRNFQFTEGHTVAKQTYSATIIKLNKQHLVSALEFNFHNEGKEKLFFLWNTQGKNFEKFSIEDLLLSQSTIEVNNK